MTTETENRKTLADIASDDGVFAIIAMDQRNTLRRMFKAVDIEASEEDLRTAKADVARALTPAASGMLLDPTFGVPAVTASRGPRPRLRFTRGCRTVQPRQLQRRTPNQPRPGTQRALGLRAGRGRPEISRATAR